MRKTLALAVVSFALTVAASGQSDSRRIKTENIEKFTAELIARSRQYLAQTQGIEVVDTGVLTLTPFGLMTAAEVKAWPSAELECPVVSIKDEEAIVTGLVIYKRSPGGPPIGRGSGVRIRYIKESGRWKCVGLCLGDCG